jgi:hypothetical protein
MKRVQGASSLAGAGSARGFDPADLGKEFPLAFEKIEYIY